MVDQSNIAYHHLLLTQHLCQVNLAQLRDTIIKQRGYDYKHLLRFGFKLYSKSEEDGIIQEIFKRIGIKHHKFVEIGLDTGHECNTAKLLIEGWEGNWIEGERSNVEKMKRHFKPFEPKLQIYHEFVNVNNVNSFVPANETDILSIDIDYNDYWIWEAVTAKPRVVVIEYNPSYPPPMSIVTPYEPFAKWDGTNYGGASLEALVKLGRKKGYQLVGCDISGSNAFFVLKEECKKLFYDPATAEELYEPGRPYFSLGSYNPPSPRPFVRID